MSEIEKLICDKAYPYVQPYFYNHTYALRCELGMGKNDREYLKNAYKRAVEIYNIIFEGKPYAFFFNYWIYDDCEDRIEDYFESYGFGERLNRYKNDLKYLIDNQKKYRNQIIRNMPVSDAYDEDYAVRRNRVVCFVEDNDFDYEVAIKDEINRKGHDLSIVSSENECILSVYDADGCDIVFASKEKMREFYPKLEKYLLQYDIEEMERRIAD